MRIGSVFASFFITACSDDQIKVAPAPVIVLPTPYTPVTGTLPTVRVITLTDFQLEFPRRASFPSDQQGSTHEITFDPNSPTAMWVTSPKYDSIARIALDGSRTYFDLPVGTAPHGEEFDRQGNLILSFEDTQQIAKFDPRTGQIIVTWDIGVDPHGLSLGSDGVTIWFTGKTANTVGRITSDGQVTNFKLPTEGALPIYVRSGPYGNMWATELLGNKIARITFDGQITEFSIPTANSRPIAIVPDPRGAGMWFSQEAGGNVGFIDHNGVITEYAIPRSQPNLILGGLAFDSAGNLWVQQYVNQSSPFPQGPDFIIRVDKAILVKSPQQMISTDFAFFSAPTVNSVLHRIVQGPDGNMWYTALKADVVGRVKLTP